MTHDRATAIHAAEQYLAERLERLGDPDPQQSATNVIRWLMGRGWRPLSALAAGPGPRRAASPDVATAELAKAREVLEAKRGNRPETTAVQP